MQTNQGNQKYRGDVIVVPVSPVLADTPEILWRSRDQLFFLLFLFLTQQLILEA